MNNYNSNFKLRKGGKNRLRLINFLKISISISISVLVFVLALSVVLKPNQIEDEKPSQIAYDLSPSNDISVDDLELVFDTTNNYWIFKGFKSNIFPAPTDYGNKIAGKTLRIPETHLYNSYPYPVKKIIIDNETGSLDSNGSYSETTFSAYLQGDYNWDSSSPLNKTGVTAIIVPDTVDEISYGAFHGAKDLGYYQAPFIGLKREVANENEEATGVRAFNSIFGYQEIIIGSEKLPSGAPNSNANEVRKYEGAFRNDRGLVISDGPSGTEPWYYTMTPQSNGNKLISPRYYFWQPKNLEKIVITDNGLNQSQGLKAINRAFWNLISAKEIQLPNKMLTFGDSVFYDSVKLETVILPDEISVYGENFFTGCISLKTVIPYSSKDDSSFQNKVTIPSNLEEIKASTFYMCSSIREVVIPSGLKVIGDDAFRGCPGIDKIYPSAKEEQLDLGERELRLNSSLIKIGYAAFSGLTVNKVYVPAGVTEIGEQAFQACYNLVDITLPFVGGVRTPSAGDLSNKKLFGYIFGTTGGTGANVIQIATNNTAEEINHTQSYTIPSTLRSVTILNDSKIYPGAFMNCFMLTSITIIDNQTNLEEVAERSFRGCYNLEFLSLPFIGKAKDSTGSSASLGWIFGSTKTAGSDEVEIDQNNGKGVKYFPRNLKSIQVTNQPTLRTGMFNNCSTIESVKISSLTTYSETAIFHGCSKLKELEIPFVGERRGYTDHDWSPTNNYRDSLIWLFSKTNTPETYYVATSTYWGNYAYIPSALKIVKITNESYIHNTALTGFSSLENISISDTVTTIETNSLSGCSSLKMLYVPFIGKDKNTQNKNASNYCLGWFFGKNQYSNSYSTYQFDSTFYIPNNLESVEFGPSTTSIAHSAFRGCKNINAVKTSATIQQLGSYAFDGCTKLTLVTMPYASYNKVGDYAFRNCLGLTDLDDFLPKTATILGTASLMGTSISDIYLNGGGFDTVGNYAFANCIQITKIDLEKLKNSTLGTHIFSGCTYLNDVKLYKDQAKPYMFENCINLVSLSLVGVTTHIPDGMFSGCSRLEVYNSNSNRGLQFDSSTNRIGAYAFKNCVGFKGQYIVPAQVEIIETGAFQGCNNIESIVIPLKTHTILSNVFRSYDSQNLEINDDFVIYVKMEEVNWPKTWVNNFNCEYPVNILGSSVEDIFEYQYDPVNLGWRIIGINRNIVSHGDLVGTLFIPDTYRGLNVVGIGWEVSEEDGERDHDFSLMFQNDYNYLNYITDVVLGKNIRVITQDAFHGGNPLNIYSQASINTTISTLYRNQEQHYIRNGRIYYKESWTLSNNHEILWNTNDLVYEFFTNTNTFIYNNEAHKPEFNVVHSKAVLIGNNTTDEVAAFFNVTRDSNNSIFYTDFDDSNLISTYKNNINAGQAEVNVVVNSSKFNGRAIRYFTIQPQVINLFNTAYNSGAPIIKTYDGKVWSFKNFDEEVNVFNLVDGHEFTGTLETTSQNAGRYYGLNNGFRWSSAWKVRASNGADVSNNYYININTDVVIEKFIITSFDWTGYKEYISTGDYYTYSYTGLLITPGVVAVNEEGLELNLKDALKVVHADANSAIFPSTYQNIATAEIVDKNNLAFPVGVSIDQTIRFQIVKADVKINFTHKNYVIGEFENYFSFNDFANWQNYNTNEFTINITGLGPHSTLYGTLVTSDYLKGIYKNISPQNGKEVLWQGNTFEIKSSIHKEANTVDDLVENDYYNIELDASVNIVYNTFKYYFTIDGKKIVVGEDGVVSFVGNTLIYEGDGRDHSLALLITNITGTATITFNDNTGNNYLFTALGNYEVQYKMEYPRFDTILDILDLEVRRGTYNWNDLTKEYDAKPIDPNQKIKRTPIDYSNDTMDYEYYRVAGSSGILLPSAPVDLGDYYVIINTKENHSDWYKDVVDKKIYFSIVRRSLYIHVVDGIHPYDSKEFDSFVWLKIYDKESATELNLLPNHRFSGTVQTNSAAVGIYVNQNDFVINNGWKVINDNDEDFTKYYKIVFVGPYEITERIIDATIEDYIGSYDGSYHSPKITVNNPNNNNYEIFYNLEKISIATDDKESVIWSRFPYSYYEPGEYTIYIKIVAPNYKTFYGSGVVQIDGLSFNYSVNSVQTKSYDGYQHGVDIYVLDPWNYTLSYALVTPDQIVKGINYGDLTFSNTCPRFTELGEYNYVIRLEAPNYKTIYENVKLVIDGNGPTINATVTGFIGPFDNNYHSPSVTVSGPLYYTIYYYQGICPDSQADLNLGNVWKQAKPEFINAGNYDVTVKILAAGYAPYYCTVKIIIEELIFNIQTDNYDKFFDGDYHGVTFIGLNDLKYPDTIGGISVDTDVTIYYNTKNDPFGATSWVKTPIEFKNVGTYMIYVIVTAPNYKDLYLNQQIIIRKDPNPVSVQALETKIPYSATPMKDFELVTIHDGARIYKYYQYDPTGIYILPTPIAKPQNLGKYYVEIELLESNNCKSTFFSSNFEIVPRKLILTFENELEYTGNVLIPEITVDTGTTDIISVIASLVPSGTTPIELGTYNIILSMVNYNSNYEIEFPNQTYIIVPRKIHVEYFEKYEFDNNNWYKDSEWEIDNILNKDDYNLTMTTISSATGDYHYTGPANWSSNRIDRLSFSIYDKITLQDVTHYYDITWNVHVKIVYPELEIDVNDKMVDYDGFGHTIDVTIITQTLVVNPTIRYWTINSDNTASTPTSSLYFTAAGIYEIFFSVATQGYETYYGSATLHIKKSDLIIGFDTFDETYNNVDYRVNSKIIYPVMGAHFKETPIIRYFKVSDINENELIDFLQNGRNSSHPFYNTYIDEGLVAVREAFEYYAVCYYNDSENTNASFAITKIKVKQKGINFYFNNLTFVKNYDKKKFSITLSDMLYYDVTDLVNSHLMLNNYKDYIITTSSANAGFYDVTPGSFEFLQIQILEGISGKNISYNYFPIVHGLEVTINKIPLVNFEAFDTTKEYDGLENTPTIKTDSDGLISYTYYKYLSDGVTLNPNPLYGVSDVGKFFVEMTIGEGTNYFAWSNPPITAIVTVTPRKANVLWDNLSVKYNGEIQSPGPYIIDVFNNKAYLDFETISYGAPHASELKDAGSYVVNAFIEPSNLYINTDNYILESTVETFNIEVIEYIISGIEYDQFKFAVWKKDFPTSYLADTNQTTLPNHYLSKLSLELKKDSNGDYKPGIYTNLSDFIFDFEMIQKFPNGNEEDVSGSFKFLFDFKLVLEYNGIIYKVSDTVTNYTNTEYFVDLQVLNPLSDKDYSIAYKMYTEKEKQQIFADIGKFPGDNIPYEATNHGCVDVGTYYVFFKISLGDGDNSSVVTDWATITINKRQSNISFGELDKVYDGATINNTYIRNKILNSSFNGKVEDLVFQIIDLGSGLSLQNGAVDAGSYKLIVTSNGDNAEIKNYTDLYYETVFEITPAILKLTIKEEKEVTTANPTYNYHEIKNIQTNITTGSYALTGIVNDNAIINITVKSLSALNRGSYIDKISATGINNFNYNQFSFTWEARTPSNNDITNNYILEINYNIKVRYKLMEVEAHDCTFSFAKDSSSNPIPHKPVITVKDPLTNYTIEYGYFEGSYESESTYNFPSTPGIHTVYFKVTANNYEDYYGSIKVTINYNARVNGEDYNILSIDKTYDGYSVNENGINIINGSNTLEQLPAKSTWTIRFFKAVKDTQTGEYVKTGNPMTNAVDAGHYIYQVIIPNGIYYGKTTIEEYFEIKKAEIIIDGTASKTYDGGSWIYNLNHVNPILTINYTGLAFCDTIISANLATNKGSIGTYANSNISLSELIIQNNNGKITTSNYKYTITLEVEITEGTILVEPKVSNQIYTGYPYTPYVTVLVPGNNNDYKLTYSKDGVNYQTGLIDFVLVDNYTLYVRVEAFNYTQFDASYNFAITKSVATVNIKEPLTRQYNSQQITNPTVITSAQADDPVIKFIWLSIVGGVENYMPTGDKPINVGSYAVIVEVSDTDNFSGKQEKFYFEITPCILSIDNYKNLFTYNGLVQTPTVKFKSTAFPNWEINNITLGLEEHYFLLQSAVKGASINKNDSTSAGSYCLEIKVTNPNFEYTTQTLPYTIDKRAITIKMDGQIAYQSGLTYVFSGLTSPCYIVDILPSHHDFVGVFEITETPIAKIYEALSPSKFNEDFHWSTPFEVLEGGNNVTSNYIINYDIKIQLMIGAITYTAYDKTVTYDGNSHVIDLVVHMDSSSYKILWANSQTGDYSTDKLTYKDADTYVIWFKITSDGYQTVIDSRTLVIEKAQSDVNFQNGTNLDKVYDGVPVNNPLLDYTTNYPFNKIEFKYYYLDVQAANSNTYVEMTSSRPINVHSDKYKLVVILPETENYLASSVVMYFEITPRTITITATDTKVFDGSRWQRKISNDPTISDRYTSASITGLAQNQFFYGTIQTITIDAYHYKIADDFEYYSEYSFKTSQGQVVDNNNYIIDLNLDVLIGKAEIDAFANDIKVIYDGDNHYIKVEFNPNNPIKGSYTITYSDNYLTGFTPINIPKKYAGTHPIYYQIQADNYKLFSDMATITITGMSGTLILKAPNAVYDGSVYNALYIDTLSAGAQTITYYEILPDNSEVKLNTAPTDAGNYLVRVRIAPSGIYNEEEGEVTFSIDKASVTVIWGSTNFPYTGTDQLPTGTASFLLFDNSIVNIPLSFSGKQVSAGNYDAANSKQAVAAISDPNLAKNYTLTNDKINFTIRKKIINTPVFDPADNIFTYGETIFLTDVLGNVYHLDSNGKVSKIEYADNTIDNNPDPLLGWSVKLGERKAPGNTVYIVLNDKNNTEWSSLNHSNDLPFYMTINPFKFDRQDLEVEYDKNKIRLYTGFSITFDSEITVSIKGSNPKEILKLGQDYTLTWSDNINIGKGKFKVTGIGNYEIDEEYTFNITNPEPDYFILSTDSLVDFVEITIDYDIYESVFTELGRVRTNMQQNVYLGRLYEYQDIPSLLAQFDNPSDRIKVFTKDDVEVLPGPDNDYGWYMFGTGSYLVLCDQQGNEVDRIYGVLSGDVNGDAMIDTVDLAIITNILNGLIDLVEYDANWEVIPSVELYASLILRSGLYISTIELAKLCNHLNGLADLNQDFCPW